MRTLLLLPPTEPGSGAAWGYAWVQDDQLLDSGQAAIDLLPHPARGQDCALVWPAARLSWQRVILPTGSLSRQRGGARLRQILDGLLEDLLLQDLSSVHLALAPDAREGAPTWVAVTALAPLKQALAALTEAGLQLQRVVPEATPDDALAHLGGPEHAPRLYLPWPLASDAQARCPVVLPWSEPPRALREAADAPQVLSAEPAVAARAAAWADAADTQLLSAAARAARALRSDWNLAQLGLKLHTGWRTHLAQAAARFATEPRWRPTRWALAAWVVVQVAGLNVWAWQTRQNLALQRAQLRDIFTQTFPQTPVVVDPVAQMARELEVLRQQRGADSGLNTVLSTLAGVAPASYALQSLRYIDRSWTLEGPALAPDQADTLRQRWQAAGWRVEGSNGRWSLHPERP